MAAKVSIGAIPRGVTPRRGSGWPFAPLRQLLQGTVTQRSDVIRSSHQVSAEPPSLPTSPPQANVGHAEPAAGLVGLLSMPLSVLRAHAPPNAQLRTPNLNVTAALSSEPCALPTQPMRLATGCEAAASGVSSFGYSGTIAHAVLRRATAAAAPSPAVCAAAAASAAASLAYSRRRFGWREAPHPFAEWARPPAGGSSVATFTSRLGGALLQLVADHLVRGRGAAPGGRRSRRVRDTSTRGPSIGASSSRRPASSKWRATPDCEVVVLHPGA